MSDSSAVFSGTCRFSNDFQSVIDRAVAIASLPLAQLSNRKNALDAEARALDSLQTRVDAVRSALSGIESAGGPASWSASVSDPSSVRATVASGTEEALHTIEVTSLGACTSTMSSDACAAVADPTSQNIATASSYTLTVDGSSVSIVPEADTLSSLVSAINAAGLNVRAAAVNIGTASAPDYRLSIQGTKLAATAIQLDGAGEPLLETLAGGSEATYKLDGTAITLRSDSRTVEIAPGLTVQMLRKSETGVETSITVSHGTSGTSAALGSFCAAYNAAMDELDTHRGQGTGALLGSSTVSSATASLRQAAQYAAPGGISSLSDLGVTFDQNGRIAFDVSVFQSAAAGRADELASFLGSADEGGFLKDAGEVLDGLILTSAKENLSAEIAAQQERIDAEGSRIEEVRSNLLARMAAADALIASLEQQATYITNLFESMRSNASSYA